MTTQPEALRLADDRPNSLNDDLYQWAIDAEDALRRLHEVNQELLVALKEVYITCDWHGDDGREAMMKASAAINKAEGEQNEL